MTTCTICGLPTAGWDDDDAAYCAWCFDAHVAWSAERPQGLWRWPWQRARRLPGEARVLVASDDGREA